MITIEKQNVTPEMEIAWLAKNGKNRKLTDKNVLFLSGQMQRGEWKVTGDPVKFDVDGKLLDGQHRLQAVVKSNKTIEMFVCKGLDSNVFDVLDTGRTRTAGDVLSSVGYKHCNNLASITKGILLFENGFPQEPNKVGRNSFISNQVILKFIKKNPELEEIASYVMNEIYAHFRCIGPAILGTLYYLISQKNQTKADAFFEKYANGIDLSVNNPIRRLRERLLRDQNNKTKLSPRDKYALTIIAWNAFIKGKEIESLSLRTGYEFPKIV